MHQNPGNYTLPQNMFYLKIKYKDPGGKRKQKFRF
jgi:hypothetical protein